MTRSSLLLIIDDSPYSTDLPSPVNLPRLHPPSSSSSSSSSASSLPPEKPPRQQSYPNIPFHYCIPLTVILLLAALFFIACFSLYVRCFGGSDPSLRRGAPYSASKGRADSDIVGSLPVVSYGASSGVNGDHHPHRQSDCAVCLSEFEEAEAVKVIPRCRHVFHPDCLDAWLSLHGSCPVCRSVQLSWERS